MRAADASQTGRRSAGSSFFEGKVLDPHQNKIICVLFYDFPAQPKVSTNQPNTSSNHVDLEGFYLLLI